MWVLTQGALEFTTLRFQFNKSNFRDWPPIIFFNFPLLSMQELCVSISFVSENDVKNVVKKTYPPLQSPLAPPSLPLLLSRSVEFYENVLRSDCHFLL